jgi:hypothetical protein
MTSTSNLTYNISLTSNNKDCNNIAIITQEDAKQILLAIDNKNHILNDYQNNIKNKIFKLNEHRGLFHGTYTARFKAVKEKLEEVANNSQKIDNKIIKSGYGRFFLNYNKYYVNCMKIDEIKKITELIKNYGGTDNNGEIKNLDTVIELLDMYEEKLEKNAFNVLMQQLIGYYGGVDNYGNIRDLDSAISEKPPYPCTKGFKY